MKNAFRIFYILIPFLVPVSVPAQYHIPQNNVWVMSNRVGVTFNTTPPSPVSSEIYNSECSAAVCNNSGVLQFYTQGTQAWTASGTLMPNGNNINGIPGQTSSITQGSLIVPVPNSSSRYYLFTLARDLYVNVVDMNLNNGNGDIDLTFPLRGTILADSLGEKMIAIRGCNNNVWVLVRRNWENKFLAFEITANGINTAPVESLGGHAVPQSYYQGEMKAAPDGSKIMLCNSSNSEGLELFRFDHASGIVYQPVIIDSTVSSYGGAFSPDGTKFYSSALNLQKMVQYDLSNNYERTLLGESAGTLQVKLAVDGKIYFLSAVNFGSGPGNSYLGRINQPNNAGVACLFQDSVTNLAFANAGASNLFVSLPNEVVTVAPVSEGNGLTNRLMLDTSFCVTGNFPNITLNAFPVFTGYIWDNGATGSSRTINQGGTYWVNYNTACGRRTDTFKVNAQAMPDLQIQYNAPVLSANNSYSSYQWYKNGQVINGAVNASYTATDTGWYSLKVTDGNGCSDSAFYQIKGATSIGKYVNGPAIVVFPNPVKDMVYVKADLALTLRLTNAAGFVLAEEKGNKLSVVGYASGIYFLQIRDGKTGRLLKVHKFIK